jgi:hypothetical protein
MRCAVRAKFEAHHNLQALLISTADEILIEATVRDDFWGCGADGSGKNWLGRILMELRAELQSTSDLAKRTQS